MIKYAVAAFATMAAAAPAIAQEQGAPVSFTGGHIEVIGGFDRPKFRDDEGGSETANAFTYGIAGGFDFESNGFVFGIEAEATESTAELCELTVCVDAKRDLYAGGRIGAVVGGGTLLYVKGGYTNLRFGLDADDLGLDDDLDGINTNLDGVRAGIGAERNVGNFLVKLEYRYSNYEADVDRHQAVVGVGFRF